MKKSRESKPTRTDELRRLIKTAALKVDAKGSLGPLAVKAGLTEYAIRAAIRKGRISAGMACALELADGRDVLKKEVLCPEKFAVN